jgi:hypothetical protein
LWVVDLDHDGRTTLALRTLISLKFIYLFIYFFSLEQMVIVSVPKSIINGPCCVRAWAISTLRGCNGITIHNSDYHLHLHDHDRCEIKVTPLTNCYTISNWFAPHFFFVFCFCFYLFSQMGEERVRLVFFLLSKNYSLVILIIGRFESSSLNY